MSQNQSQLRQSKPNESSFVLLRLKKGTVLKLIIINLAISIFCGFILSRRFQVSSHLSISKNIDFLSFIKYTSKKEYEKGVYDDHLDNKDIENGVSHEELENKDSEDKYLEDGESEDEDSEDEESEEYDDSRDDEEYDSTEGSEEYDDSEDDEEYDPTDDLEDEHIERLYEIYTDYGMSHEVFGFILALESSFLMSENELMSVMSDLAKVALAPLLSVHCSRSSSSLSCVSVMADRSNIIFHSINDVLHFDIFLSGHRQVMIEEEVFEKFKTLISKYYRDEVHNVDDEFFYLNHPTIRWKMHVRNDPDVEEGERYYFNNVRHPFLDDITCEERFLGNFEAWSKHIDTIETPFQRIDVYDFMDPRRAHLKNYYNSIIEDDSYESRNPELFQPNRIIFLDGVMQSSSRGNEAYHEALVQPAMFAHTNPHRVAIIGGGEGATLREALKHKSVEKVTMIDIDEVMCKGSAKLLYPAWNGCNDFFNSSNSCFDDPRADVRYEDALAWFMSKFDEDPKEEKFDIIIMDALDPQDTVEFAEALYQNLAFWQSLYNALTDDGMLVAQLGEASELTDAGEVNTQHKNRHLVVQMLQDIGFLSFHVYEEPHSGFEDPWTFLVACKSIACRSSWYRTPAEINLDIHQRIHRTISKQTPLKFFDGATMARYHVPHKATEAVYCRDLPTPQECIFDQKFYTHDKTKNSFTMNVDGVGKIVPISSSAAHTLYHTHAACDLEPVQSFLQLFDYTPEKESFYLKTYKTQNVSRFNTVTKSDVTDFCQYNNSTSHIGATSYFYSPVIERHLPLYANLMIEKGF